MARYFTAAVLLLNAVLLLKAIVVVANFYNDFDITWSNDHAKILDNGREIQLSLDKESGTSYNSTQQI